MKEANPNMPQSDGKNTLKRFEFVLGDETYRFKLNPEEYSQDEPSRSTVTQTKGGAWIDDFGGGLEVIFMRGSTGMNNGYQRFVDLRKMIRKYRDGTDPGNTPTEELKFHNFTDEESWIVHLDPSGFKLFRSKTNPLLYMYELRLICLRKATTPKIEQKTEVIIDRDEFQENAEMENLRETMGNAWTTPSPSSTSESRPTIPSRVANGASEAAENSSAPSAGVGIGPRSTPYLQTFADIHEVYEDIRPKLDNRLSPLGLYYYNHILNGTYNNTGREFTPGSLGYVVYNELYPLKVWDKFGDVFALTMLDLYAITDSYYFDYKRFKDRVGREDILRLIENIRWLVEGIGDPEGRLDMVESPIVFEATRLLRQVELLLSRMRKDPTLFDIDISHQLSQLNHFRGEGNV